MFTNSVRSDNYYARTVRATVDNKDYVYQMTSDKSKYI